MKADTGQSQQQQAKREAAIAKIVTTQPNEPPLNQNAVSPEEMGAVRAQTAPPTSPTPEAVEPKGTPQEEGKGDGEQPDSYSQKLALLARRERANRAEHQKREQALKAKEAEIQKREEALTGRQTQYDTDYVPKSRLKDNPFQALAESGVDPTLFADQMKSLSDNPVDPRVHQQIKALEATIARMEKSNEEARKASEQASQDQYTAAVRQISRDVTDLVKEDPYYEAIRTTKSQKDVVELIEETFRKDGRVMAVEEAAKEVEDYLAEQLSNYATQIKKIKARLTPDPVKQESKPEASQPPQPQMKTLTNDKASTRRPNARERAIAAMEGRKLG